MAFKITRNKFKAKIEAATSSSGAIASADGVNYASNASNSQADVYVGFPNSNWKITENSSNYFYYVDIDTNGQTESVSFIPPNIDGGKVYPMSNAQLWLKCANINKNYTTIEQILADTDTLAQLVMNENANNYLARASQWAAQYYNNEDFLSAIGASDECTDKLITSNTGWRNSLLRSSYLYKLLPISTPTMTSNTEPSGKCSSSNYTAYYVFDKDVSTGINTNAYNTLWIKYAFKTKQKCYATYSKTTGGYTIKGNFYVYGIDEDSNEYEISTYAISMTTGDEKTSSTPADKKYVAYKVYATRNIQQSYYYIGFQELDFLCREGGVLSWLKAGGITNKYYFTLAEVLADSTTLNALMASSDAVDYLAECPSWASTICADSGAMTAIGANNYCADTLLADSEWREAICNSTYRESVLNVKNPVMTSATAPSGEASAQDAHSSYPAWKAFDASTSSLWVSSTSVAKNATSAEKWLCYKFASAKKMYCAIYSGSASFLVQSWSIKGSNDNDAYTELASGTTLSTESGKLLVLTQNIANYQYYRLYLTQKNGTSAAAGAPRVYDLRFYGREDV